MVSRSLRMRSRSKERPYATWTTCRDLAEGVAFSPDGHFRFVGNFVEAIGENSIGQMLGRSPIGEDGIWPSEVIRDVLEDFGTSKFANAMSTGLYDGRRRMPFASHSSSRTLPRH